MSDNAKTLVERLKGLAAKATPGPWGIYPKGGLHHPSWIMYPGQEEKAKIEHATGSGLLCWGAEEDDDPGAAYGVAWRGGRADEEFIAASREGVPALIDEITRLERELAEARRERDAAIALLIDIDYLKTAYDYYALGHLSYCGQLAARENPLGEMLWNGRSKSPQLHPRHRAIQEKEQG